MTRLVWMSAALCLFSMLVPKGAGERLQKALILAVGVLTVFDAVAVPGGLTVPFHADPLMYSVPETDGVLTALEADLCETAGVVYERVAGHRPKRVIVKAVRRDKAVEIVSVTVYDEPVCVAALEEIARVFGIENVYDGGGT